MQKVYYILRIAGSLRTGLNDAQAPDKLLAEKQELLAEIANGDHTAALTEAADIAYFAVKSLDWAACQVGVDIDTLLDLAIAKYGLRAQPGNPKDKTAESLACSAVIKR